MTPRAPIVCQGSSTPSSHNKLRHHYIFCQLQRLPLRVTWPSQATVLSLVAHPQTHSHSHGKAPGPAVKPQMHSGGHGQVVLGPMPVSAGKCRRSLPSPTPYPLLTSSSNPTLCHGSLLIPPSKTCCALHPLCTGPKTPHPTACPTATGADPVLPSAARPPKWTSP